MITSNLNKLEERGTKVFSAAVYLLVDVCTTSVTKNHFLPAQRAGHNIVLCYSLLVAVTP
jgi:hypothetical protein